jgi:hypothetical protein
VSCAAIDYLYAATVTVFAVTASVATWWHSSLAKVLQLRHPSMYALLGQPALPRTAESDKHALAMLRFVMAGEYKLLNDDVVVTHVRVLQVCTAINAVSIIAVAAIAFAASSPESILGMRCWRDP